MPALANAGTCSANCIAFSGLEALPSSARFARGRWEYGRLVATPRGRTLRWFQPSAFTQDELDSAHFHKLRTDASAGQADVAVIELELQYNRRAAGAA